MRLSRSKALANTAVEASISAIEVYNKPDFRHREETFAILMVNAWELLLKARILKENGNKLQSIWAYEPFQKADGTPGKRQVLRRNRSGNPRTIELPTAIQQVSAYHDGINDACRANLSLLIEIRNNAVHFTNREAGLAQRVQELGTASLRNFMHASIQWFEIDFSRYNFFLMPIAFYSPTNIVKSIEEGKYNKETANLLTYMAEEEAKHPSDTKQPYNVCLQVDFAFVKSKTPEAIPVKLSKEVDATKMQLSEEDFKAKYPYSYAEMIEQIRKKKPHIKLNNYFNEKKKSLEKNANLCHSRYLDPDKPQGIRKKYYSQAMVIALLDQY